MKRQSFGAIDRRESGRWRARYTHPTEPFTSEGTPNRISAPTTFRTKTEAREWLTGIQADIARGTWKSPERIEQERIEAEIQARRDALTFGQYAEGWMNARDLTSSTRRLYTYLLDSHLLPTWKDSRLKAITTADVKAWLAAVAPGAPTARARAYALLRTILSDAVEDELLDSTPCKRNLLGRVPAAPGDGQAKHERIALTGPQLDKLANEVPRYLRVPVLLSGLTGLRSGELRALRASALTVTDKDTPHEALWLNVTTAVTGEGKHLREGAPKTKGSVRAVKVPESLRADIEALAKRAGKNGRLFTPLGKPDTVIPHSTFQANITRAGERLGLGHISPHMLRHTAATLAKEAGYQPTDIRDLLGHSTTRITNDVYTHTGRERHAAMIDAIDRQRTQTDAEVIPINQRRRPA